MLISKKSLRESKLFRSRFSAGEGTDFALRQYHRCQEELSSALVQLALQMAFVLLLALFGRAMWHLFIRHGQGVSPWFRYLCLAGIIFMVGSAAYRTARKVKQILVLRGEIRHYRQVLRGEGTPGGGTVNGS